MKEIYFCIDFDTLRSVRNRFEKDLLVCLSYDLTENAIKEEYKYIATLSLAHFSFDLLDSGYDIYLCYQDNIVKIEPHMDLSGIGELSKDLRYGHNIFRMFKAGIFNNLIKWHTL